jgi:hypothetical protein
MPVMALRVLLAILALAATTTVSAQYDDHATSRSLNRALGVECAFCHEQNRWSDEGRPPRAVARRMMAMVTALNEQLRSVGGHITCWTCHAGARVPSRIEPARWEPVLAAWPKGAPASNEVKLTMAVYSASVGRTCAGCHESNGTGPATEEAVTLVRTMNGLFTVMKEFLPPTARTQCFMCHKGRPHPQIRPAD